MQKVKLIDVMEKEVQEGQTYIRVRVPNKLTDHPDYGIVVQEGAPTRPNVEKYNEIPIHWFHHTDKIEVHDRRAEGINLRDLINNGYTISQERQCYEKIIKHLVAVTPEAAKFIEIEKCAIEELKSRIENLSNSLSLSINTSSSLEKQLQDENNKRWSYRFKQCLSNFGRWLNNITGI